MAAYVYKKSDLHEAYNLNYKGLEKSDDPKVRGKADRDRVDKDEFYEVVSFINHFGSKYCKFAERSVVEGEYRNIYNYLDYGDLCAVEKELQIKALSKTVMRADLKEHMLNKFEFTEQSLLDDGDVLI